MTKIVSVALLLHPRLGLALLNTTTRTAVAELTCLLEVGMKPSQNPKMPSTGNHNLDCVHLFRRHQSDSKERFLTIRDDISHPGFVRLANDPLLQTQPTYILLCSYGLMYRRFFIHSSYLSQPIYAGPEYITHNNPLRYGCVVK